MRRRRTGNVYLIQRGGDGPIKIGATAGDPLRRMATLQTASPETLYLIGCVRGSEDDIHQRFRAHHISGEWFVAHEDILSFARLNNVPPRRTNTLSDYTVGVRVSKSLRAELEIERRRMSAAAGAEVKLSAVIRAILREELLGRGHSIEDAK